MTPLRGEANPCSDDPTDEELLSVASRPDGDRKRARLAEDAFYRRHVRYLYGVLKRRDALLRRLAAASAEDLVQETFQRAFQYGATFRAGDGDREEETRRARAWLGRIATNLIADGLKTPSEVSASPWIERVSCEGIDEPAPPSSPEVRAVRRAMDELSEREQDVLRVSALYERSGEAHQRLPNDVSAELADRWGTNSQNIRAIRSRAMKKLTLLARRARDREGTP